MCINLVEPPAWLQVLQYPSLFATTGTGLGFTLKRWQWANEKAKNTDVSCRAQPGATVLLSTPSVVQIWNYGVRQSMYSLPIPLAGHCVVVLFNRRVVFLGGGEVALSAHCLLMQRSQ